MELGLLFMISCVLIARKFEKQKMQLASLAYSIAFIVILFVLMFTVDIEIVQRALINVLGRESYFEIHEALLDSIGTAHYGISVAMTMSIAAAVQFAIIVLDAFKTVVCYCFIKRKVAYKFKKAYFRFAQSVRSLYLPRRINLLYCRMLN